MFEAIQYYASSHPRRDLSDIDQTVRVHFLNIRCLPYDIGNPHIRRRFRSRLGQNRLRLLLVTAIASVLILSIKLWLARSLGWPTKSFAGAKRRVQSSWICDRQDAE
jgi:hypothetical protein